MELSFFTAKPQDADEICQLVNSAYRGESARAGWTHEADLLGGVRIDLPSLLQEITDPKKVILFARDASTSEAIASVCLEWVREAHDPTLGCYLGMLSVKPTLQAHGLGKRLMNEAEAFAKKQGANRMILGVIHARAELIAWYERRGYLKSGITKPFPYDHPLISNPARKDFHFVFFEKKLTSE